MVLVKHILPFEMLTVPIILLTIQLLCALDGVDSYLSDDLGDWKGRRGSKGRGENGYDEYQTQ